MTTSQMKMWLRYNFTNVETSYFTVPKRSQMKYLQMATFSKLQLPRENFLNRNFPNEIFLSYNFHNTYFSREHFLKVQFMKWRFYNCSQRILVAVN